MGLREFVNCRLRVAFKRHWVQGLLLEGSVLSLFGVPEFRILGFQGLGFCVLGGLQWTIP